MSYSFDGSSYQLLEPSMNRSAPSLGRSNQELHDYGLDHSPADHSMSTINFDHGSRRQRVVPPALSPSQSSVNGSFRGGTFPGSCHGLSGVGAFDIQVSPPSLGRYGEIDLP